MYFTQMSPALRQQYSRSKRLISTGVCLCVRQAISGHASRGLERRVSDHSTSNATYIKPPSRSTCSTTGSPLFNCPNTLVSAVMVEVGSLLMA